MLKLSKLVALRQTVCIVCVWVGPKIVGAMGRCSFELEAWLMTPMKHDPPLANWSLKVKWSEYPSKIEHFRFRLSMSLQVVESDEKLWDTYDFLLILIVTIGAISYRFRDNRRRLSKTYIFLPHLLLTSRRGVTVGSKKLDDMYCRIDTIWWTERNRIPIMVVEVIVIVVVVVAAAVAAAAAVLGPILKTS